MRQDLRSMNMEELRALIKTLDEPAYRAAQLFEWLHYHQVSSLEEMSSLPKSLKAKLSETCDLATLQTVRVQESAYDGTRKYLFALPDGERIESVFMRYHFGNSVCISSEAGCRMGCKFCASTLDGLKRMLTPGEMCEQVYAIGRDVKERISHVVVMGMGEPLENYDHLLRFLQLITEEAGSNLSARAITVSTCGLVPEMKRLAAEHLQINLAVSLHAPTQEKRLQIMPVAAAYPLDELMAACRDYYEATRRQLTFEYALLDGINASKEDALLLSELLRGLNAMVNLIPVNPVAETGLLPPNKTHVLEFKSLLEKNGIHVTIRREMGRDIDGACGQLRRRMT